MKKKKLQSLLISKCARIKEAMQQLNDSAEKILFIVADADRLLGTVTDGDIRRGLIEGVEFSADIEKIMKKACISLRHSDPNLEESARQIMIDKKIEHIPVLDGDGVIVDVISWTDILTEKKDKVQGKLKPNQVVIMAGGKGTRLDPFTKILPKPLIPLGNETIIELIMDRFYQSGFHRFTYTLNYKKEYIKLFLKENVFPYEIEWVEEENFLGTAGSLSLLKDKFDDSFFVANCDSLLDVNFDEVLKWHREHDASITILGCHNEIKIPFGVLEMSAGRLDRMMEKPSHDVIINTGVYVIEPHVLSFIPDNEPMDMNQLIGIVGKNNKVSVFPMYGGWIDIGQWEEYRKSIEKMEGPKIV